MLAAAVECPVQPSRRTRLLSCSAPSPSVRPTTDEQPFAGFAAATRATTDVTRAPDQCCLVPDSASAAPPNAPVGEELACDRWRFRLPAHCGGGHHCRCPPHTAALGRNRRRRCASPSRRCGRVVVGSGHDWLRGSCDADAAPRTPLAAGAVVADTRCTRRRHHCRRHCDGCR